MKDEGRTKEYYSLGERKVTKERVKMENKGLKSGIRKEELGIRS